MRSLGRATASRLRVWRAPTLLALLVVLSPAVPYGSPQSLQPAAQRAAALLAASDQPAVIGEIHASKLLTPQAHPACCLAAVALPALRLLGSQPSARVASPTVCPPASPGSRAPPGGPIPVASRGSHA